MYFQPFKNSNRNYQKKFKCINGNLEGEKTKQGVGREIFNINISKEYYILFYRVQVLLLDMGFQCKFCKQMWDISTSINQGYDFDHAKPFQINTTS
jgi:hypothetical protein